MDLSHILNWELKAGSHEFPGPSGGTCINEAAIVAAGFEYRAVRSAADCPPCFCPVLSEFAISVNDGLSDEARQRLMIPLVTRLAGSRDAEEWVAEARAAFILMELERDVFRPILESRTVGGEVDQELERSHFVMRSYVETALRERSADPRAAVRAVGHGVRGAEKVLELGGRVSRPSPFASDPKRPVAWRNLKAGGAWLLAAQALTRAFRIGTQAPAADTAQVAERMEAVKARARELAKA